MFFLKTKQIARKIIRARGTSEQIALGVAIGCFFGVMPIPGQYAAAVIACTALRANWVVAFFPVWLTNPVTAVPLYAFNYWIGWLLVGGPDVGRVLQTLKSILPEMEDSDTEFLSSPVAWIKEWLVGTWENVTDNFGRLAALGWEALLPLYLGSCLVGLLLSFSFYYGTLFMIKRMAMRLEAKRQLRKNQAAERSNGTD